MKVVGLITEYNPFHNGHLFHLNQAKAKTNSDYSIAIMSGNFLQRGEPALMDKWTRAQIAVANGVDLVIELPTFFALNSAEYFAKGSVSILNSLGIVDTLIFGSEHGKVKELTDIANHLVDESSEFKDHLQAQVKKGLSFPKARANALNMLMDEDYSDLLNSPNNILGIEYIKWLIKLKSTIKVDTVLRTGTGYHDTHFNDNIASATAVRKSLKESHFDLSSIKEVIPKETLGYMDQYESFIYPEHLYPHLDFLLRVMDKSQLDKIHDINEGLENRILKSFKETRNYLDLIDHAKSKRYTQTRIQRILTKTLLNINDEYIKFTTCDFEYMRILSLNEKGQELVKRIKKTSEVPIITNLNKVKNLNVNQEKLLELDIKASELYALLQKKGTGSDYRANPMKRDSH